VYDVAPETCAKGSVVFLLHLQEADPLRAARHGATSAKKQEPHCAGWSQGLTGLNMRSRVHHLISRIWF
ncbi:unnamed protein product, partial [Durusdinium trenchii]